MANLFAVCPHVATCTAVSAARPAMLCMLLQEDKAKNDALNERAKQMKASRAALGDRSNAARELRVARNRGVVRAHERLARLRSKARGDERAQRLEALKACPGSSGAACRLFLELFTGRNPAEEPESCALEVWW